MFKRANSVCKGVLDADNNKIIFIVLRREPCVAVAGALGGFRIGCGKGFNCIHMSVKHRFSVVIISEIVNFYIDIGFLNDEMSEKIIVRLLTLGDSVFLVFFSAVIGNNLLLNKLNLNFRS